MGSVAVVLSCERAWCLARSSLLSLESGGRCPLILTKYVHGVCFKLHVPKQGLRNRSHAFDLIIFCMALIITNKIQIWAFYTTPGSIWSKGVGNQLENWMYTKEGIIQYLSFGKTHSNHRGFWDALSQEPFTGGQGKCGMKEEPQTASQEPVWRTVLPTNTNSRRAIPSVFNFDFFKYSDFLSVLACS